MFLTTKFLFKFGELNYNYHEIFIYIWIKQLTNSLEDIYFFVVVGLPELFMVGWGA